MKKFFAFIVVFVVFTTMVPAQWVNMKDIKVATLEMVSRVPGESLDTATLTEMFQVALVDRGAFKLVERSLVDKILAEQEFQTSGLTDSQIARIGAMVGANKILSLTISRLGSEYILIVKSVDTSSGIVDLTDQVQCSEIIEFIDIIPVLADRFIRKARGEAIAAYRRSGTGSGSGPGVGGVPQAQAIPVAPQGAVASVGGSGIPRDGLVSEWLFTGEFRDSVLRRMSKVVDVKLGKDRFGQNNQAAYFNGKSSGIDAGAVFTKPVPAFSVALWYYAAGFNKPPRGNEIIRSPFIGNWNKWEANNQKGFDFGFFHGKDNWGQLNMQICDGNDFIQTAFDQIPGKEFAAKYSRRWMFACLVSRDGSLTLYIDSGIAGKGETVRTMMPDLDTPFWFGRSDIDRDSSGRPTNFFNGALDDIRIYERALEEWEVLALFDAKD